MTQLNKKSTGFTQISNELLLDKRLSLKAKGLYCYLFSKPNNWEFYHKIIIKELKEGREAIDNAIKELENFGWLKRIRKKTKDGKFANYDYMLEISLSKQEKTSAVFPALEKPATENQADNNNTYINNTYINNNYLFFRKLIKKYNFPKKIKDKTIERLYQFLKAKFNKCLKDFETFEELERKIEEYLEYLKIENWRKKCDFSVFINQPQKYLNDWKTELAIAKTKNPRKLTEVEKIVQKYGGNNG